MTTSIETERPVARGGIHVGALLRGLGWDVALPVVAYYALHLAGAGDRTALVAATSAAALRVLLVAVRDRTLNPFAVVMMTVFGVGLAATFVTGDPRFLLLKGSLTTGGVGVVFLLTALRGRRPLTLAAMQSFRPEAAAEEAEEYRTDPAVRRGHRVSSTVWGAGLVAEAALRIPLIYLLPVSVMVGVSAAMMVATFAVLIAWNVRYLRRHSGSPHSTGA